MRAASIIVLMSLLELQAFCQDKGKVELGPSLHGTINVLVANDRGIVVLTDSMLTEDTVHLDGTHTYKQLPAPGQKLFRIDDRTVCAFAGFAAADTPPLPDFLNSIPAMIGRYEDRLRSAGPLSVSDKLELLQGVFAHYLTGIANIRGEQGYQFELFIAGYDLDGTAKAGRLVLGTNLEQTAAGPFLRSTAQQLSVFPINHHQIICLNGIPDVALQILGSADAWANDPSIPGCQQSTHENEALSIDQMKALAVSLKGRTADRFKEVGGPSQIAVLSDGRLQSIEQPHLPPIQPSGYKFAIVATDGFGNTTPPPGTPPRSLSRVGTATFVGPTLYALYFSNHFFNTRQELQNAFYGGNVFENCTLTYSGGQLQFAKSNKVTDSELEIGEAVRTSPVAKQLLKGFHWKTVTYTKADSTKQFPWMTK